MPKSCKFVKELIPKRQIEQISSKLIKVKVNVNWALRQLVNAPDIRERRHSVKIQRWKLDVNYNPFVLQVYIDDVHTTLIEEITIYIII